MNAVTDKATENLEKARAKAGAALETGRAKAGEALDAGRAKTDAAVSTARAKRDEAVKVARARADDAAKVARAKTDAAITATRTKAKESADAARAAAKTASAKTSEGIEANPVLALVGGLALGAIAAALLPKTRKEGEVLGKASNAIRGAAAGAAKAAQSVGKEHLDAMGINADAAKDQVRDIARKLGEAAGKAGTAAADSIRTK